MEEKLRAHSLRFLGPKQCFVSWPNQGFGADCKIYMNRKIDPSIQISIKESISISFNL